MAKRTLQIRGTNLYFTDIRELIRYLRDNDLKFMGAENETADNIIIDVDTTENWRLHHETL